MNPLDFMKNFQKLHANMKEAQEKLKTLRCDGFAGGDLVKVTVDGMMEVHEVKIDPIAVDPRDVTMLEELIGGAVTDAVRKMRVLMQQELSPMTGGFPPGFGGGSSE